MNKFLAEAEARFEDAVIDQMEHVSGFDPDYAAELYSVAKSAEEQLKFVQRVEEVRHCLRGAKPSKVGVLVDAFPIEMGAMREMVIGGDFIVDVAILMLFNGLKPIKGMQYAGCQPFAVSARENVQAWDLLVALFTD